MNKPDAILECLYLYDPNIESRFTFLTKNNKITFAKFVEVISMHEYNLAKQLPASATTISTLLKSLFPHRPKSNTKLCGFLLGLYNKKYCCRCKWIFNYTEFRSNNSRLDALNTYCRTCHSETTASTQAHRQAKRRAIKLSATPSWADLEKIKEIYRYCPKGHHVDHIIPLQGDLVCGLHVEGNLQYLSAQNNLHKGNKYPGMV